MEDTDEMMHPADESEGRLKFVMTVVSVCAVQDGHTSKSSRKTFPAGTIFAGHRCTILSCICTIHSAMPFPLQYWKLAV